MSWMEVGRVVGVWRYPVKSMAGESLPAADVSWNGVAGDRRWAFVRPNSERSGFPWLTQRQVPAMARYVPRLTDTSAWVRTPSGADLEVVDPALAAQLGEGVRVLKSDRGVFDTMPLSLLTTGSLEALSARTGPLDVRRFRPNVIVEAAAPFAEEAWVGRELRIGSVRLRVDGRDQRCAVVGVDPDTTDQDPAILATIVREREARFGVYGSTIEPGRVALGDAVLLRA